MCIRDSCVTEQATEQLLQNRSADYSIPVERPRPMTIFVTAYNILLILKFIITISIILATVF